jgi:hypothetical protein
MLKLMPQGAVKPVSVDPAKRACCAWAMRMMPAVIRPVSVVTRLVLRAPPAGLLRVRTTARCHFALRVEILKKVKNATVIMLALKGSNAPRPVEVGIALGRVPATPTAAKNKSASK